MKYYRFHLAVDKTKDPGTASDIMAMWLPHGFRERVFIQMEVPERCHGLAVGNTAEQLTIVTDTKVHVSFSLFSLEYLGRKCTLEIPEGAGHEGR